MPTLPDSSTPNPQPVSRSARAALIAGLGAVILVVGGIAGARFGWFASYRGFAIFGLGLIFGGLGAFALGIVGLIRTRPATGRAGRGAALAGLGLGSALLAALLTLALPHRDVPPIHDITTAPEDPPIFRAVAKLPANLERDLSYPNGNPDTASMQRSAYPDLETIRLSAAPEDAFEAATAAARNLGWEVVWTNRDLGFVEASETTRVFRFIDDVAIRIRPAEGVAGGAVVDVRSTSRDGVSDLGANARRIRAFRTALEAALAGAGQ